MAGNNILIFDYATNRGPKQCKLQDSRGMKFFPMLLELVEEPISEDAAFAGKLQRLGALQSVERWRQLREIHNQVANEYEDAPALKAAVLNRFIDEVGSLLAIWMKAEAFYISCLKLK